METLLRLAARAFRAGELACARADLRLQEAANKIHNERTRRRFSLSEADAPNHARCVACGNLCVFHWAPRSWLYPDRPTSLSNCCEAPIEIEYPQGREASRGPR